MATEPTASSGTDAPEPRGPEEASPASPQPSAQPASSDGTQHDAARRAFFKEFGRQALTTAGQVAGMAEMVSRTGSSAAASLLGLEEPKPRRLPARTTSRGAASLSAGSVDHTYRSPYRLDGDTVVLLDQRAVPEAIEELVCRRGSDVAYHLRTGVCRGGPVMAQVAAYGLALTARERQDRPADSREPELRRTRNAIAAARPSSRLPVWAMERLDDVLGGMAEDASGVAIADALRAEADAIASRFQADHNAIASHLVANLPHPQGRPLTVLVHGDPGALSGGLFGTGIAALSMLAEQDRALNVFVTETRPFMEGARLASWELRQLGVDHHVIADSAVAWLFARETVDVVLIAPEWIAADGATAGVIGSRAIALQAEATAPGPDGERPRIYVCGSSANVDPNVADGESIPLEMRPARELTTYLSGVAVRASDAKVPATDVMPPGTIHALVTEQGVANPVTRDTIAALLHGAASEAA